MSLDESPLSSMSVPFRAPMVLLRACLSVAISFLRALAALSAVYVTKFFACVMRRVFIVYISLRTMAEPLQQPPLQFCLYLFFRVPSRGFFLLFYQCR